VPSFIKITPGVMSVVTNSILHVGSYAIRMTGCFENKIANVY
jgi:hypothetical protein